MEIKLEELEYQQTAIKSVVNVFDGNNKNTFDNACFEGIRSNVCSLTNEQLSENIKSIVAENGIDEELVTSKNGFFFHEHDLKKIAEEILFVLNSDEKLEKVSESSKAFVKQFDWNIISQQYWEFFEKILKERA
jgi:glycosyltransferase involved in cell wall biosynthesis